MKTLAQAFDAEIDKARACYRDGHLDFAMSHLATAHILGQRNFRRHWQVHGWMLRVGMAQRNFREVVGQAFRLVLVPLGHLTGRLPVGNPGHARVSAFEPMPVPPDLQILLDQDGNK